MSSGNKEIVPAIIVLPLTIILSAEVALNSISVVSSTDNVKLPPTVSVPILLPGASVPAEDA